MFKRKKKGHRYISGYGLNEPHYSSWITEWRCIQCNHTTNYGYEPVAIMEIRAAWDALHPEVYCRRCGSRTVDNEGNSLRVTEAVRKVVTLIEEETQYTLDITYQTRSEYDAKEQQT
jgi:hypothetical protein